MKSALALVFFLCVNLSGSLTAATIHVPADQPTIQAGIDAAVDGDTVLVADGTWTGEGNRDIDFLGKTITVCSEGGPEACIIDCQGSPGNPHRGFSFTSGEAEDSILEGFTITNGYADDDNYQLRKGGGIFCHNASPRIEGNVITGNEAVLSGGAIWCWDADPRIENNIISDNTAVSGGGGIACVSCSGSILNNTITGNSADKGAGVHCAGSSSEPMIRDNTFSANVALYGGAICCADSAEPLVVANTISGNRAYQLGGGIHCENEASPVITANLLLENEAGYDGGAISCYGTRKVDIDGNEIIANTAGHYGGGIYIGNASGYGLSISISSNVIAANAAVQEGAAVCFHAASGDLLSNRIFENEGHAVTCTWSDTVTIMGNSIFSNTARGINIQYTDDVILVNNLMYGNLGLGVGAVCYSSSPYHVVVRSCTITENAGGVMFYLYDEGVSISNSIVWGNKDFQVAETDRDISFTNVEGGYTGAGNINSDPLFVSGPLGDYYLSQIAAGQAANSPCADTGDPASEMIEGTTRTDSVLDLGVIDMGYHTSLDVPWRLVAGPGPGYDNPPVVRIFPPFEDAAHQYEFSAYGVPLYGVSVSCGDVNGDGTDDVLTGAGPGPVFGPHVRGFEVDGTPMPGLSFLAYGTNKYGVNVAAGDLDGDGTDEIITGAGPGAVFGPHVRGWVYGGSSGVTPYPGVSYFAYGTPKWGVNVATGDIDGDGYDEIVTGPGPGAVYGPHVRGWNADGGEATAIPTVSFLAYGTNKFGVNVSCGDMDGDGIDEIVTGAGPGAVFGPHVRGWNCDGGAITPLPGLNFFAWDSAPLTFGVNVFAGADLNDDGRTEVVAGRGPDPAADTEVKVFTYDGSSVSQWLSLETFSGLTHGTNVAAGRF